MEYPCVILLLLSTTILPAAVGVEVVGGSVVGAVDEDLVLPCSLKPNTSAVDEEVIWKIEKDIVHHYKQHQDILTHQLPDYRGRTSLSREELQRGIVSLKLTSLRLSDAHTYRCIVSADTWQKEAPVLVTVETVGSSPNISTVSVGNGSVVLRCETAGWSSEPQLEWLDARGKILSAGDPEWSRDATQGFTFTRNVTVQESDGCTYVCRVSKPMLGLSKETRVEVPKELFDCLGNQRKLIIIIVLLVAIIAVLAVIVWRLTPWRRLWRLWTRHKIPKDLDVCMTTPRSAQLTWRRLSRTQPAHTFQVTQQRDGADPVILPLESLGITHPDNPELCRAEMNDLTPGSRYVFKVSAIRDGKKYPSSSVSIRTALTGQQELEMEPHQDRGERQPLNQQP